MGLFSGEKPGASSGAAAAGGGGPENVPPSLGARADVRAASAAASGGATSEGTEKPTNKGGRPKGAKDTKPRKVRNVARKAAAMVTETPDDASVPTIDPGVIESAIKAGLQSIDQIVARRVEKTALVLTGDANESKALAQETALQPAELKEIPKLAAYCLGRHGLLGEYAPEVMLAALAGGYAVRVSLTFKKLDDIARIQRAAQTAEKEPPPAAN